MLTILALILWYSFWKIYNPSGSVVSDKGRTKSWNVEKLTFPNIKLFWKKSSSSLWICFQIFRKSSLQKFFSIGIWLLNDKCKFSILWLQNWLRDNQKNIKILPCGQLLQLHDFEKNWCHWLNNELKLEGWK